jgi:hypothetical protein
VAKRPAIDKTTSENLGFMMEKYGFPSRNGANED